MTADTPLLDSPVALNPAGLAGDTWGYETGDVSLGPERVGARGASCVMRQPIRRGRCHRSDVRMFIAVALIGTLRVRADAAGITGPLGFVDVRRGGNDSGAARSSRFQPGRRGSSDRPRRAGLGCAGSPESKQLVDRDEGG